MLPRSLDAAENLPKQVQCQVALRQSKDKVPGGPNEAAASLEQAPLQTRQGPTLDVERQEEAPQQIAEVVGDGPKQKADPVGSRSVTRHEQAMWSHIASACQVSWRVARGY
jgi:hypothetical protein